MRTVLISGANGFIAQNAAKRMKDAGYRTIGVSRRPKQLAHYDAVYKGVLSGSIKGVFEENIDVFIHCAYHSGKDDYAINVEGTRLWAKQASEAGIKHQIFLSSISARRDSPSSYSRAKHVLDQWFIAQKHSVFRLGLVVGKGGLFQRMANLVRKYPVLPILNGGASPIFVSGIEEVSKALTIEVGQEEWAAGKTWNLFQSEPYYLREVLEEIKKQAHTSCAFISVPAGLALAIVRGVEKIPFVKLGISSNNIIGMRQNAPLKMASDYSRFGLANVSLELLVAGGL
jgi:uncharacterized protein YbjT (DUF2867 family)